MIRTRSAIGPLFAGPGLLAELAAAKDGAVVIFELQQHDGSRCAAPARDELAACRVDGTPHRAHALPRFRVRDGRDLRERGLPDTPPPPIEVTERPGVRPRQRADEIVDHPSRGAPVDLAVGGPAARQHRLVAGWLPRVGALAREPP